MRTSISAAGALGQPWKVPALITRCAASAGQSSRAAAAPWNICVGLGCFFPQGLAASKHCLCLVEMCHNPCGLCVVCPFFTGPQGRTCSISGQLRQQSFWLVVSLLPVVSVHRRFYLSHAGRKAHLEIGMLCSRKPCSRAPGRSCCRCSRVLEMLPA